MPTNVLSIPSADGRKARWNGGTKNTSFLSCLQESVIVMVQMKHMGQAFQKRRQGGSLQLCNFISPVARICRVLRYTVDTRDKNERISTNFLLRVSDMYAPSGENLTFI